MKKILITLLCASLSFSLYAQLTLTNNDLPQAGMTFLVGNDLSPSVSLGSPDPAWQLWDFSSLTNDYPKVADYDTTALTPYAGIFTASNTDTYGPAWGYSSFFGGAPVDSGYYGYMFWRNDTTGFHSIGFRAENGPYANINVFINPPELLIGTPATYGTVFNNSCQWELPLNRNPANIDTFYTTHVNKTLTADAWGELITPYGTFADVIRIHEYVIKTDSVRMEYFIWDSTFLFWKDTSNNYMYLQKGTGYPLAIVHADKNNVIEDVEYMIDSEFVMINLDDPKSMEGIQLYPNPAQAQLVMESPDSWGKVDWMIYDFTGKEIFRSNGGVSGKQLISVEDLAEGAYLFRLKAETGREVIQRFVKISP